MNAPAEGQSYRVITRRLPSVAFRTHQILDHWSGRRTEGSLIVYCITVDLPSHQIVFVHGITVPSLVFKDVAETLVSNGFRVLLYGQQTHCFTSMNALRHQRTDMYGRGYSEAPKLPCDPNLSIIQLALLLQYIGWDAVDTIVGFSMVSE